MGAVEWQLLPEYTISFLVPSCQPRVEVMQQDDKDAVQEAPHRLDL